MSNDEATTLVWLAYAEGADRCRAGTSTDQTWSWPNDLSRSLTHAPFLALGGHTGRPAACPL